MNLLYIAFSLFLLMDSIGNIPLFISFLKHLSPTRQREIIIREMLIALIVIILFNFLGVGLMSFLHITCDTIQIAGGIILFILALKMVFPTAKETNGQTPIETEPFIVPLAIPLVAGPAVLAAVMIFAQQESHWVMVGGILIAWAASLIVLLLSSFLQKILGQKGIIALERLMGLILILISIQMFMTGISGFIANQASLIS